MAVLPPPQQRPLAMGSFLVQLHPHQPLLGLAAAALLLRHPTLLPGRLRRTQLVAAVAAVQLLQGGSKWIAW